MANLTEVAYLAGIIDGEGSICAGIQADRGYNACWIRLHAYNTKRDLLDWIASRFGGTVYAIRRSDQQPNHRQPYQWVLTSRGACGVLGAVLPYLILKRRQAEIVLALQTTRMPASAGRKRGLTSSVKERRERLVAELHDLNRVGCRAV